MSILDFMVMTGIECLLYTAVALFAGLSIGGLGHIFAPNRGIMTRTVAGMTFAAALVLLSISFVAALAKYIIYGAAIIGLIINLYHIVKSKGSNIRNLQCIMPMVVFAGFFLVRILLWVVPADGVINFNCHSTYFSGIAMELTRADYFSRLRIYDVYPYEWSTYHFFNGSFTGLLLAFMPKINYVSYLLAKFATISIYMAAIFELLKERYSTQKAIKVFAFAVAVYFVCAYNAVTWSSYTNNYSCVFMFMIMWLALEEEDYRLSTLSSLGFAISAGRSLFPGGCMFLYSLYQWKKAEAVSWKRLAINYKIVWPYIIALSCGAFATAFSGIQSGEGSFGTYLDIYVNSGALGTMPLGSLMAYLREGAIYNGYSEFLILAVYGWLIYINRINLNKLFREKKKAIFRLLGIFIIYAALVQWRAHINFLVIVATILTIYVLPIAAIGFSTRDKMLKAARLFIGVSLLQCLFFKAGICLPNYGMISVLSLWCFVSTFMESADINIKSSITKAGWIIAVLCMCGYSFETSFWAEPEDHYHKVISLQQVEYSTTPYEFYGAEDEQLAILNAMKGNRVHYNIVPTREDPVMYEVSMSMSFLPKNYNKNIPLPVE